LAVKIRLARAGAKKAPFYRVIAADGRATRDGRFLEILGRYNPRTEPSFIELDLEKVDVWIGKGAQPTEAAAKLIAIARGDKTAPEVAARPSKKVVAKVEAEKKAVADAAAKAVAEKKAAAEAAAAAKAEAAEAATAAAAAPEAVEAPAEESAAVDAEPAAE
jgi:small subunit ribosomal protein S16